MAIVVFRTIPVLGKQRAKVTWDVDLDVESPPRRVATQAAEGTRTIALELMIEDT